MHDHTHVYANVLPVILCIQKLEYKSYYWKYNDHDSVQTIGHNFISYQGKYLINIFIFNIFN